MKINNRYQVMKVTIDSITSIETSGDASTSQDFEEVYLEDLAECSMLLNEAIDLLDEAVRELPSMSGEWNERVKDLFDACEAEDVDDSDV